MTAFQTNAFQDNAFQILGQAVQAASSAVRRMANASWTAFTTYAPWAAQKKQEEVKPETVLAETVRALEEEAGALAPAVREEVRAVLAPITVAIAAADSDSEAIARLTAMSERFDRIETLVTLTAKMRARRLQMRNSAAARAAQEADDEEAILLLLAA